MSNLITSFIVLPALIFAVAMAIKTHRINKDTERIIQETREIMADTKRRNLDAAEHWERTAELRAAQGDVYGARTAMSMSRTYRAMAGDS